MSLTPEQKKYLFGSFIVGVVLAILFGILAGTATAGTALQKAYIGACVVAGLAGIVGLIIFLAKR